MWASGKVLTEKLMKWARTTEANKMDGVWTSKGKILGNMQKTMNKHLLISRECTFPQQKRKIGSTVLVFTAGLAVKVRIL